MTRVDLLRTRRHFLQASGVLVVTRDPPPPPPPSPGQPPAVPANPAEGAIALSGAPGSEIPGSIAITSTGTGSTLDCTVSGSVTAVSPLSQPIPAGPNGSVSFAYTCTAGSPGVANAGTISCTTGGTDPDDVLDYTLACLGASNAPIPAMGGLGKALLVSLMIGLGLLGLGARRQMI